MNDTTSNQARVWTTGLVLAGSLILSAQVQAAATANGFFDTFLSIVAYYDADENELTERPTDLNIDYATNTGGERQGTGGASADSSADASLFFGTLSVNGSTFATAPGPAFGEAWSWANGSGSIFLSNDSATDGYFVDVELLYSVGADAVADFGGEYASSEVTLSLSSLSESLADLSDFVDSSELASS